MTSFLGALEQIFWAIFLMPVSGFLAIKCFLEDVPPEADFACAVLFTIWLLQLLETIVVVAVIWFLWWAGVRVLRKGQRSRDKKSTVKI